jgi:hypothetical protein
LLEQLKYLLGEFGVGDGLGLENFLHDGLLLQRFSFAHDIDELFLLLHFFLHLF